MFVISTIPFAIEPVHHRLLVVDFPTMTVKYLNVLINEFDDLCLVTLEKILNQMQNRKQSIQFMSKNEDDQQRKVFKKAYKYCHGYRISNTSVGLALNLFFDDENLLKNRLWCRVETDSIVHDFVFVADRD